LRELTDYVYFRRNVGDCLGRDVTSPAYANSFTSRGPQWGQVRRKDIIP